MEICDDWRYSPLAFWTHVNQDGNWHNATHYQPPAPLPGEGGKYKKLVIELFATEFEFTSAAQVEHFIAILSSKVLPSTIKATNERKAPIGPNCHWLSRFPSKLKSFKKRAEIAEYLRKITPKIEW